MTTETLKNHDLPGGTSSGKVLYEERPVLDRTGAPVEGLHSAWITLDNPEQLNSYTTEMVKDVILAFRRASNDRSAVAAVFTGSGTRAFCSGGNTAEYAEYYSGRPGEYQQYMRLFNDMVTSILHCDVPVINRVNGLRIAGGQEIGMACDVSIASDLASFGQAGPKHGSAPDGGATDFLPLFVGIENATVSCALCETWSAHKAARLGLVAEAVPVLKVNGEFISNPLVETKRYVDERGRIVFGEYYEGEARTKGQALLKSGTISFEGLDRAVQSAITRFLYTFPGCVSKTLQSMRKHKLHHWDLNRETNRSWLGLNMMTEARAGFRAFHEGEGKDREIDFVQLRRALARGERWGESLIQSVLPESARRKAK
jgi:6-oxo-cyclohex-1-ene-carbonyl-CoA hydrolase